MARKRSGRSGKKGCFPWWVVVLLLVLLIGGAGAGGKDSGTRAAAPSEDPAASTAPVEDELVLATEAPTPEPTEEPEPEVSEPPVETAEPTPAPTPKPQTFILNTSSMKYHDPYCSSVDDMQENNKRVFEGTREEVEAMGYKACQRCGG